MSKHEDARNPAAKPLAWLLMLSTLALFGNAVRLQIRPSTNTAVAHRFTQPNPVFTQAYQAALASAE